MTPAHANDRVGTMQLVLRWVMIAIYLYAGYLHVVRPHFFLPIMPAWVPAPRQMVIGTGLCEIVGAIGLVLPRFRRTAGILLAIYAVCVFPANIKHALDYILLGRGHAALWYHIPRLLFQPVIVWWSLFVGGVVDWPFGDSKPKRA